MHRPVDWWTTPRESYIDAMENFYSCWLMQLLDLCWYARGLTPLTDGNGENVDDLEELLESRGEQSSRNTYFEIEVFPTYGPWKRNSHQYRTSHGQHPPGFQ